MPKLDLINSAPAIIKQFKGLYSRGSDDSAPLGYFLDCLNIDFEQNEAITRSGQIKDFDLPNIRRFAIYKRLNETTRYLILDTNGNFYDSLFPSTPLVTNALFLDFSMVNYFNRAYITFHTRVAGVSGSNVYVYEGAGPGTLRFAAGSPPTGFTLGVATSASAGTIELGKRLFAIAYETTSGFITKPGPSNFTLYDGPGNTAVDISSIPIGPSGTVARWILVTKGTTDYDGNQFGLEFFFGTRIGDNSTTTLNGYSFFDADLINSADYLFDNLSLIPAGLGLTIYSNRIAVYGIPGFEHYIFLSKAGDPETIDETSGVILIDPSDAITGVVNLIEFRNSLYICNKNRTLITTDNGNDPITWSVDSVDKAVGTSVFGLSKILDYQGANTERFFACNTAGCFVFESGVYRKPEFSYNIANTWKRINKTVFNKIQCVHDPDNYKLYISVPLDAATECSHLFVADYSNALNLYGYVIAQQVKWSIWNYSNTIRSIAVDFISPEVSMFKVARTNNIYYHSPTVHQDDGVGLTYYIKFALVNQVPGWIHHFGFLSLRAQGTGNLSIDLYGMPDQDGNADHAIAPAWTISNRTYNERKINFVNEKLSLKLSNSNANEWTRFIEVDIKMKPLWMNRPQ